MTGPFPRRYASPEIIEAVRAVVRAYDGDLLTKELEHLVGLINTIPGVENIYPPVPAAAERERRSQAAKKGWASRRNGG